jgi:opacity protein-like surface antigen
MKKIIISISAILCSCSAWAVNGPYVGIGLGYMNTTLDRDENISYTNGAASTWEKGNVTVNGFQGQAAAGYAYDISSFRLGGEIIAQKPRDARQIVETNISSSSYSRYLYQSNYAYGINLAPGYYVTPSNLIYLKLGAMRGNFDFEKNTTASSVYYNIFDESFNVSGLNLGLGTEMYFSKNIGVKLEYLYTRYQEKKLTDYSVAGQTTVEKLTPQTHTVTLGVDYQFDFS